MRVVLAGGGTAGHIEPALAIAAELERQQLATVSDIHFIGGFRGLEGRIVPARGYQLHQIKIVGFPRKINFQLISYPWQFIKAVLDLRNFFKKVKPTFVMGFGGYVAAPSYAAAKLLRIPIVIHESNARPGVTNQRTAKHAALVIESFAQSLPNGKLLGTPIRHEIAVLDRSALKQTARSHFSIPVTGTMILVFGGSQGAEKINQAISGLAHKLTSQGIHLLHIVGDLNLSKYQGQPTGSPGKYVVLGYCDRMDLAYAAADLAITRSGALTVAELACAGLPAILVPYPVGNGEQEFNAAELVAADAAALLRNQDCTESKLKLLIDSLLADPSKLEQMGKNAMAIARPTAAADIVAALRTVS